MVGSNDKVALESNFELCNKGSCLEQHQNHWGFMQGSKVG